MERFTQIISNISTKTNNEINAWQQTRQSKRGSKQLESCAKLKDHGRELNCDVRKMFHAASTKF